VAQYKIKTDQLQKYCQLNKHGKLTDDDPKAFLFWTFLDPI
jgi:hypothetical protein